MKAILLVLLILGIFSTISYAQQNAQPAAVAANTSAVAANQNNSNATPAQVVVEALPVAIVAAGDKATAVPVALPIVIPANATITESVTTTTTAAPATSSSSSTSSKVTEVVTTTTTITEAVPVAAPVQVAPTATAAPVVIAAAPVVLAQPLVVAAPVAQQPVAAPVAAPAVVATPVAAAPAAPVAQAPAATPAAPTTAAPVTTAQSAAPAAAAATPVAAAPVAAAPVAEAPTAAATSAAPSAAPPVAAAPVVTAAPVTTAAPAANDTAAAPAAAASVVAAPAASNTSAQPAAAVQTTPAAAAAPASAGVSASPVCKDYAASALAACPKDFTPVCAYLKNDTSMTFANPCTACAFADTVTFTDGACSSSKTPKASIINSQPAPAPAPVAPAVVDNTTVKRITIELPPPLGATPVIPAQPAVASAAPAASPLTVCPNNTNRFTTPCTRQYVQVCAVHSNLTRQTFNNPCLACADPTVVYHKNGACSLSEINANRVPASTCPATPLIFCNFNYLPVCAYSKDGSNSTQSNGCLACLDRKVFAYKQGSCPVYEGVKARAQLCGRDATENFVCYLEVRQVCAYLPNSKALQTFSDGCTACKSLDWSTYKVGKC